MEHSAITPMGRTASIVSAVDLKPRQLLLSEPARSVALGEAFTSLFCGTCMTSLKSRYFPCKSCSSSAFCSLLCASSTSHPCGYAVLTQLVGTPSAHLLTAVRSVGGYQSALKLQENFASARNLDRFVQTISRTFLCLFPFWTLVTHRILLFYRKVKNK